MRCGSCGIQNSIKDGFCKSCGAAHIDNEHHPRLGQYRLLSRLGEGGMGIVYRAYDEANEREVALKVLHPHLLKQENLRERFRREARVHGRVRHPNIVNLLALYEDEEHMALVMEMVHGQNLRDFLRARHKLTLGELLRIARGVLQGLEAAHRLGIVHRDIKPGNVLLSEDGRVKLMDFGLAKPESGEDDLTKSGATIGSFRYMSPEQILNQPVDARTDLYSLGIVLYEMCTGKPPFDAKGSGAGEFEIMEKQVRETPLDPRKRNKRIPESLARLIMRLLSKRPEARYADCAEVLRELDRIEREERPDRVIAVRRKASASAKPQQVASPVRDEISRPVAATLPTSDRKRRLAVIGVGALFALAVVAAMLWREMRQPPSPPPTRHEVAENKSAPVVSQPATPAPAVPTKKAEHASMRKIQRHKNRPVPRMSLTFSRAHRLKRFDGTRSNAAEAHEFRGGSRTFFKSLESYRWKDKLRSYKQGWLRLSFNVAQSMSRIVIHRASVGGRDFSGGHITLGIMNSRGKYYRIFERRDRAIDRPVTVSIPKALRLDIKSVELRFRSPEPITIGPIDLLP